MRQHGPIRRALALPVFQVSHLLLLWPPWCPAVTWLCLIALQSSESCSLILPTLCPTSLHNHPAPNFPYRSHWLSFVCVWKASSRLLARGRRQSAEQIPAASWGQGWFIIPGLGFVCLQLLVHFRGLWCAESIDGEANAFECKITPHLIMMLLIAAGRVNCHLSSKLPLSLHRPAHIIPFQPVNRRQSCAVNITKSVSIYETIYFISILGRCWRLSGGVQGSQCL